MHDPVFVAFATQKGGAGKSTLTALAASYLHYVKGIKVLAIDCDNRQHSMVEYREKDKMMIREDPVIKRRFENFMVRFGGEPYGIVKCAPEDATRKAQEKIDAGYNPEYVFFDITGTVNDRSIVTLLSTMDYIFVPVTPETGDLKSSIGFAHRVNEFMLLSNDASVKGLYLVWNKVQPKDRDNLCLIINRYVASLGIESLDTILPLSVKYTKDGGTYGRDGVFRSTFMPPDKRLLKGSRLPELVDEIINLTATDDYGKET